MKKQEFKTFSDAGHSWLKVPTVQLVQLGLTELITGCSYFSMDYNHVYLEEDLDALTFINEVIKRGYYTDYKDFNSHCFDSYTHNSPIRCYPPYCSRQVPYNLKSQKLLDAEKRTFKEFEHKSRYCTVGKGDPKYMAGINIKTLVNRMGKITQETRECLLTWIDNDFARRNLDICISHGFDELQHSHSYLCSYANVNIIFLRDWDEDSYLSIFAFPVIEPEKKTV